MTMQQDAKLLIEDSNIDRYIDAGSSQIEELSIGNFKVEITSAIVIGAGVLLGAVPKIANYVKDVYSKNISDLDDRIAELTNQAHSLSDKVAQNNTLIHDSTKEVFSDMSGVANSLDGLKGIYTNVFGADPDVLKVIETLKDSLIPGDGMVPIRGNIQNSLSYLRDMKETVHNGAKDVIESDPDLSKVVSKLVDVADKGYDQSIAAIQKLGHDLTSMDKLSEKVHELTNSKFELDNVSQHLKFELEKVDKIGNAVVWGVIFIVLIVIVMSIIEKIMSSPKSNSKSVSIKKAISFMKSTKRIISKSLTKKSR